MEHYFPNESLTWMGMEGFVDAMVLVEGLKRAGSRLKFTPQSHKGFHKVYWTVVRDGKAETFTDWSKVKQ